MTDYSEVLLEIQQLLKAYHNATLKCDFHKATTIAIKLSDTTFKLESATIRQIAR
jgi:hypothetical protein